MPFSYVGIPWLTNKMGVLVLQLLMCIKVTEPTKHLILKGTKIVKI